MNKEKLQYFKSKLLSEKNKINETISLNSEFKTELSTELSFYDNNHPADTATELVDKEKGLAIENNELSIAKKIDDALFDIENGGYGVCKKCGSEICEERLEFIPYAEYCVSCQKEMADSKPRIRNGYPFSYYYNDFSEDDQTEDNPIEMISNEQYRNQLPD